MNFKNQHSSFQYFTKRTNITKCIGKTKQYKGADVKNTSCFLYDVFNCKKNSNNCNLVLNQSNCNCFFFSPTKMNLATFIFIVAKVIFLGGNPRERIFPNSIIHDSNLVGENLPFSFYFGFPRCVF